MSWWWRTLTLAMFIQLPIIIRITFKEIFHPDSISLSEYFPQETVISECEGDKGNFLCGPEWKVKITTKADQQLDIEQVLRSNANVKE